MDYGVSPALWIRDQAVLQPNKALQLTADPLRGPPQLSSVFRRYNGTNYHLTCGLCAEIEIESCFH